MKSEHYTDLDGMRGVLACTVMLFHYGLNTVIAAIAGGHVPGGLFELCVDFFFVLSGFVLAPSFLRVSANLPAYFAKRLRRLAPMLLLSVAIMLLLKPVAPGVVVAANLLMVQSILGMPSLNFPSWSIPFELFFPAVGLVLLPWLAKLGRTPVSAALIAALLAGGASAVFLALHFDNQALRAAIGLAAGMLLYLFDRPSPSRARPRLALALFGLAVFLMLVARAVPHAAFAFHTVTAACILCGARSRTVLSSAPIQALGRWSYSIYLLHIPVLTVAMLIYGGDVPAVAKPLLVAVTIILAGLAYAYVERPAMLSRRTVSQPAP